MAAIVAAVFALPVTSSAEPPAPAHASASPKTSNPKKKAAEAKKRARIRQALRRQMRRNPSVVLKQSFMRQAAFVDFKLPLTVRLNRLSAAGPTPSDDELEIAGDDSVIPWPLGPVGVPPAPQISNLTGGFTMESSFSDSDGYGELGAMESIIGGGIGITATPFRISEFAGGCGNSQLEVDPGSNVTITSAGPKYGLMNLFSGVVRGSLALRMTFSGQSYASCGAGPTPTDQVNNTIAVPMPVRFDGQMRVSPAITVDGKTRIGVLTVDDNVTPQLSTFAYVRACTSSAPCNPMQFPARLKLKRLTAELLIGNVS